MPIGRHVIVGHKLFQEVPDDGYPVALDADEHDVIIGIRLDVFL